jgi:transketolase
MRKQFIDTVKDIFDLDDKAVLILGDIGVFGFRELFAKYSDRTFNIGILEQSSISVAAGLSKMQLNPIVHTIAPFLVERSLEQLKIDFGFQNLVGSFVSVGASYDYASLGATHHCPGDIAVLSTIPNMSIIVPGSQYEFDKLFKEAYSLPGPKYFRLSEKSNFFLCSRITFGRANLVRRGTLASIIVVGNMLDRVLEASKDLDVNIIYYTTIEPFDYKILKEVNGNINKIIICEPYYSGGITKKVSDALFPLAVSINHIGMSIRFLSNYGTSNDHDHDLGLDVSSIKMKINKVIYGK